MQLAAAARPVGEQALEEPHRRRHHNGSVPGLGGATEAVNGSAATAALLRDADCGVPVERGVVLEDVVAVRSAGHLAQRAADHAGRLLHDGGERDDVSDAAQAVADGMVQGEEQRGQGLAAPGGDGEREQARRQGRLGDRVAERISAALHLPVHDLDLVHWHANGRKRDEADAKGRVAEIATGDSWIIEGVYGWLAEVALPRADALIWLDLPWDACRSGLLARGLRRGMTPSDQDALLAWAQDSWTRPTPSSFQGHQRLYRLFRGNKAHLRARDEIASFVPHSPNSR